LKLVPFIFDWVKRERLKGKDYSIVGFVAGGEDWGLAPHPVLSSCSFLLDISKKPHYMSIVSFGHQTELDEVLEGV
jgi:hypothetical protein